MSILVPAVQYEFTKNSRLNFERDNMGLGLSQQAKTVTARKGQKWLFFGSVCGHILYKCALIRVVIVKFFIACTYKKSDSELSHDSFPYRSNFLGLFIKTIKIYRITIKLY